MSAKVNGKSKDKGECFTLSLESLASKGSSSRNDANPVALVSACFLFVCFLNKLRIQKEQDCSASKNAYLCCTLG